MRTEKRGRPGYTENVKAKILAAIKSDEYKTYVKIAEKFDVHPKTVSNIAIENGIKKQTGYTKAEGNMGKPRGSITIFKYNVQATNWAWDDMLTKDRATNFKLQNIISHKYPKNVTHKALKKMNKDRINKENE